MWILGNKLRSSMRAANALSPEPSLQVLNPHQIVFLLFLKPGMVLLSPVLGWQGQEDPWEDHLPVLLTGVPGQ